MKKNFLSIAIIISMVLMLTGCTSHKALQQESKTGGSAETLTTDNDESTKSVEEISEDESDVNVIIKDISYDDKEKTFEYLNTIIDETNRLNLLVNDILDLSKLQSNIDDLNIQKNDINELIKNIVDHFKYSNVSIEYNGIPNTIVEIDKKKIEQVIYNLISNAINYVGEDNKIIVNLTKEKEYYLIEVIDHGSGINEKDLEFIWDKYYKTDKTHNRNTIATRLGLSIVKNIL